MAEYVSAVAGTDSALVLFTPEQKELSRTAHNLDRVTALNVNYLNIRDLLKHEKVVISLDALESIKAHLGKGG
jgi:large subunit ribosomal protein L4